MNKVLVVGAGLSGATIARLLAEQGKNVTVIDRRASIGGNVYDYKDKNGILVQQYGPHIFHTKEKEVFDFLSRWTEWVPYEHRVLANIKGKLVPVPFNLTSLFKLYSPEKAENIKKILIDEVGLDKKVPILTLKQHENAEIRKFADFVYKNIFYIYTTKQWGIKPEDLGETVMNRVPVYVSYEDRYFVDDYQYMPTKGFTEMVSNILRHPNIKLKLKNDALKVIRLDEGKIYLNDREFDGTLIYTGCIEELFNYKFGKLPYRSLKFKFITKNKTSYQQAAVVNYTTSARFTRISEFTKFACEPKDKTVIVKEYPKKFKPGKNIPYYPIPLEKNYEVYSKYREEANKYSNLLLLGRLADYKYINMDIAVLNAIKLFEKINDN